jgi:hypothetical protein
VEEPLSLLGVPKAKLYSVSNKPARVLCLRVLFLCVDGGAVDEATCATRERMRAAFLSSFMLRPCCFSLWLWWGLIKA